MFSIHVVAGGLVPWCVVIVLNGCDLMLWSFADVWPNQH